jgi:hypothetical protein
MRFDYQVRKDMFDGFNGDTEALDRAIALCEARLAKDPSDAEPLVWHGAGTLFRARQAFQAGNIATGITLSRQATDEMAYAVALKPSHVEVLIPQGAALLAAGVHDPERPACTIRIRHAAAPISRPQPPTLSKSWRCTARTSGRCLDTPRASSSARWRRDGPISTTKNEHELIWNA